MSASRLPILYLTGIDRCGSTITGVMLGQHPEIAFFGELQYYPKAVQQDRSVGRSAMSELPIWQALREKFTARYGIGVFEDFRRLKHRYERWRSLPLLLLDYVRRSRDLQQYWSYNQLMLQCLASLTDRSVVCDSSKNLMRRLALGLSGHYTFQTIYLIRDARGYCWSKAKERPEKGQWKRIVQPALKWQLENEWFAIIALLFGFRRVRYEDLYDQPQQQFAAIGQKVGLNLSVVATTVEEGRPVQAPHLIAGNAGVRRQRELIARKDEQWRTKLTTGEKRWIHAIAGPALFLFGYSD